MRLIPYVPSVQPAVANHIFCGRRIIQVAEHDAWPTDNDLTSGTIRNELAAVLIDNSVSLAGCYNEKLG